MESWLIVKIVYTQGKVWKYDPFVQCAEVMSLQALYTRSLHVLHIFLGWTKFQQNGFGVCKVTISSHIHF